MASITSPWPAFRREFPVAEERIYLQHAGVSPLPLRARREMERYLDELGRFGAANYPAPVASVLRRARRLGAELMRTEPRRIFMVKSTTQGLGIAATGIPFRAGDNVVLADREFPANIRPWLPLRRRGVEVRFVPQRQGRLATADIPAAIDARTACVSLSFVQFASGFRLELAPVAEMCRQVDALFVVDAIQGLGVFPLPVEACGVDFLSADSHKWMVGPEGAGLGYVSDRALERIQPALEGWLSVERPFDFFDREQPLKGTASRFEEGAHNLAGLHGMVGSLELLAEIGVERLAERLLELTDHLVERVRRAGWQVLSPRDRPGEGSGIVQINRPGVDLAALGRELGQNGIVVAARGGGLRLSPHGYNTIEELDHVVETIDRLVVDSSYSNGLG